MIDGYIINPYKVTSERECHQPQRLQRIDVSLDFATVILTQGWRSDVVTECTSGLPDGAQCVGGWICGWVLSLIFYHESFPAIMIGEHIPVLVGQYRIKENEQNDNP